MKTEATPHAHASPTTQRAHRPAGPAAGASDLAQTDPFAQLLAGLFADDTAQATTGLSTDAAQNTPVNDFGERQTPMEGVPYPFMNNVETTALAGAVLAKNSSVTDDVGRGGLPRDPNEGGGSQGLASATTPTAKRRSLSINRATLVQGSGTSPKAEESHGRHEALGRFSAETIQPEFASTSTLAGSTGLATPNSAEQIMQPLTADRGEVARATDRAATGNPGVGDPGSASARTEGAESADFGLQLGAALTDTFEAIGAQVSLWASGKTQRASFSVREGLDDPLSVDVTLNDGVAQLSFRTDDAALRQLIQAQAPTALADALARAGLALGSLEVGNQSAQSQGQRPDMPSTARTVRMSLTAANGDDGTTSAPSVHLRRDSGSVGLDVYA